jgi:hypothetical protein
VIFQNCQDRHDEPTPAGGGRPDHRAHLRPLPDVLDVVTVVSNPARYRARYDLFRAFAAQVRDAGARLTVVELAFANRPFEVTSADDPRHVQVRTAHELWHKENLLNLGFSRLPRDARYVAWVDADLTFARPDWVQETLQQLQHYPIVQMFSEAHDLSPEGQLLTSFRSFAHSHLRGVARKRRHAPHPSVSPPAAAAPPASRLERALAAAAGAAPAPSPATSMSMTLAGPRGTRAVATTSVTFDQDAYYGGVRPAGRGTDRFAFYHHPGFAWAARREALDVLGGLFDVAVVGEADYIMAKSLVGEGLDVLYPGVSPGYVRAVLDWQERAIQLRANLGCVPGLVLHHWHGKKANRQYWDRCKILTDTQFDPRVDLKRDWQGVYQLADHGDHRSILLRDAIRAYFRARNEDDISLS